MIVMLILSSLAAALVPVRDSDEETSSTVSTTIPSTPPPGPGETVEDRIDAGAEEPKTIRIALGDQLALEVAHSEPGEVSIPDLDEVDAVEPGTPAHFDLLPTSAGTYDVRLLDPDVSVGEIIVGPRKPTEKPNDDPQGGDGGGGRNEPATPA